MRGNIKTFIEENIDLIEQKDWLTFYQNWYNESYDGVDKDRVLVDDLNDILYEAGVCSYSETDRIRKQIIYKEVEKIIQSWIDDIDNGTDIPVWIDMYYITDDYLNSHLGLSTNTIKDIVKDVAVSKDLILDQSGKSFRRKKSK